MINLIERLSAAKDQFPAGSPHRIAIWDAIEMLRAQEAAKKPINTIAGFMDATAKAVGEAALLTQGSLCEECGIQLGERIGALVVTRD